MSLESRLGELITAVGTDVKALQKSQELPVNAPLTSQHFYDAHYAAYNLKARNMMRLRRAIGRVLTGTGKLDIAAVGDSDLIGVTSTTTVDSTLEYPRIAVNIMLKALGAKVAGSGICPINMGTGMYNSRWTLVSGTRNSTTYPGLTYLNPGSVMRFDSREPGTILRLFYFDNSQTGFTYSVDGGAAVPVTTGGTTVLKMVEITGLAYAAHSLTVTAAATNFLFLAGAGTFHTSGIALHNLGWGGGQVSGASATSNWNDTSSAIGFQQTRKSMLTVAGITPDTVLINVGANDIFQGSTPAATMTGLTTLSNYFNLSDIIHAMSWEVPGTNAANFNSYISSRYSLADTLDVPMLNFRDVVGSQAIAQAAGELLSDNTHQVAALDYSMGELLARNMMFGVGVTAPSLIVLGATDAVPPGIPAGTVIVRTT